MKFCDILPYILANAFCVKLRIVEFKGNIVDTTNIQSSVYSDVNKSVFFNELYYSTGTGNAIFRKVTGDFTTPLRKLV